MGVPEGYGAVLARAGQLAVRGIVGQGIHRLAVAFVGRARQQRAAGCMSCSKQSATILVTSVRSCLRIFCRLPFPSPLYSRQWLTQAYYPVKALFRAILALSFGSLNDQHAEVASKVIHSGQAWPLYGKTDR